MKKKILWRSILIVATLLLAFVMFLPNTTLFDYMPDWWKNSMPNKGINLGLDLQGGLHLVFEVEGDKAVELTVEKIASALKDTLAQKNIKANISTNGSMLLASPATPDIRKAVEENSPSLIYAETSGTNYVFKLTDKETNRIKHSAVDQAIEKIRNRIDKFGVAEPTIQRQGTNDIVVQLPGIKDYRSAVENIGRTALLEFKLVDDESPVASQLPASIPPGDEDRILQEFQSKIPQDDEILFEKVIDRDTGKVVSKRPILLKKKALMTGNVVEKAKVNIDTRYNEPYVSLTFNAAGAKLFEDITAANVKKRLAIILDNTVYSAPVIQERISGGNAQITGNFSMEEAKTLAVVIGEGALPAPLKMVQNVTVGPSLGKDSIDAGIKAGIIGSILVILFMAVYYKFAGVIADLALGLNIILLLGALAGLRATLTLPGIAGIILAIGMAVDSNVLMFERMRDELRSGKTPRAAVDAGYDKALLTIVDSHITTLITAAVLFQFGTGPIKGFAVTLSLGVMINLFTALIGTKTVFDFINSRKEVKTLSI